jgi:hypothetical protein
MVNQSSQVTHARPVVVGLTLSRGNAVEVRLELVERLNVLVLLYRVEDDASSCKMILYQLSSRVPHRI